MSLILYCPKNGEAYKRGKATSTSKTGKFYLSELYINIAKVYINNHDTATGISYLNQGMELKQAIRNLNSHYTESDLGKALIMLGSLQINLNRNDSLGKRYLDQARDIFEKLTLIDSVAYQDDLGAIYRGFAFFYEINGNERLAADNLAISLNHLKLINSNDTLQIENLATMSYLIGTKYHNIRMYYNSQYYFQESIKFAKEFEYSKSEEKRYLYAEILYNYALSLIAWSDFSSASSVLKKASNIANGLHSNLDGSLDTLKLAIKNAISKLPSSYKQLP